jgi:hypothetical protein
MGGALALIPAALGVASQLGIFGKKAKEGKKIEYEAQAPKFQQDFQQKFLKYLQEQMGKGATPYGGQVAAPFQNPFTQGAFGTMKASPYGSMMGNMPMGGAPFVPPQPPPQAQLPPSGIPGGPRGRSQGFYKPPMQGGPMPGDRQRRFRR